ncbi:trihelix transcription factor GT-2-like [Camellia sinensis]|uniref:trihelix transcription factor GT-2-like n=1 Tax=Camellia sinensis TaxID=4442 RepID=UPI001035D0A3|nr:trihelix transcription factor GT-2-like [Camellia sinensis]
MKKIGYNRNAKRCKEKWENINKYFKRVKDSNKKRPEDSKTCPYFEMLEFIYERKSKKVDNSDNSGCYSKPEDILMLMMGQQQQQPPPQQQQQQQQQRPESLTEDGESENTDQNQEDNGGDDDDDDDNGDDYQIVANKPFSVTNIE